MAAPDIYHTAGGGQPVEPSRPSHDQPDISSPPTAQLTPGTSAGGASRRRSRRAFGSVERLPSGRFRARVIGPDGRYVAAPTTFTSRTDASLWLDLQHADLVRGTWNAPVRPSSSPSVATFVEQWIEEHPTARESTKELYRGLLRTCITPTLGKTGVSSLSPALVRRWHHRLGERLAADAEQRKGCAGR